MAESRTPLFLETIISQLCYPGNEKDVRSVPHVASGLVWFKSRLSRLKTCLETERRYWKETGEGIDEPESEGFVKELVEIGKRSVGEELVKEFETVLSEADKLYDASRKTLSKTGSAE